MVKVVVEVVVVCVCWGGGVEVKFGTFNRGERLQKLNNCEPRKRGSEFWAFYDNVIIECPPITLKIGMFYLRGF